MIDTPATWTKIVCKRPVDQSNHQSTNATTLTIMLSCDLHIMLSIAALHQFRHLDSLSPWREGGLHEMNSTEVQNLRRKVADMCIREMVLMCNIWNLENGLSTHRHFSTKLMLITAWRSTITSIFIASNFKLKMELRRVVGIYQILAGIIITCLE